MVWISEQVERSRQTWALRAGAAAAAPGPAPPELAHFLSTTLLSGNRWDRRLAFAWIASTVGFDTPCISV